VSGFSDLTTVAGGDGDDHIAVRNSTGYDGDRATIVGGAGNDTITLEDAPETFAGGSRALHTIVFGDIQYGPNQTIILDSQGQDRIENFNFEEFLAPPQDPSPARPFEDQLDFTAFANRINSIAGLSDPEITSTIEYGDWRDSDGDGIANVQVQNMINAGADDGIAVIAVDQGFALNPLTDINTDGSRGLQIADNSGAVVILAYDTNGVLGYDTFDIYFVQDVDSSTLGQAWAVNLVGTVTSMTEIGALNSIDNLSQSNFVPF
jgi:hypothetical protein